MNHEGWGLIRVFSKQRLLGAVGRHSQTHICAVLRAARWRQCGAHSVKSPEPCHSLVYTHNHFIQKTNQIVARNKPKHEK